MWFLRLKAWLWNVTQGLRGRLSRRLYPALNKTTLLQGPYTIDKLGTPERHLHLWMTPVLLLDRRGTPRTVYIYTQKEPDNEALQRCAARAVRNLNVLQ